MSSSSSSSSKIIITLRTSDKETFQVEEEVALESQTIKHMIEDINCADNEIPLPNVTSNILAKVIEYCKTHVEYYKTHEEEVRDPEVVPELLKSFNNEFLDKVDLNTLYDLILAANFLNIKALLDLTCQKTADMIRGKNPDEIRKTFNIINDFTPAEEEQVRRENSWAFE